MPAISNSQDYHAKRSVHCSHAQGMTVSLFLPWQMSTGCQGTCHIAVAVACGHTERLVHIDSQG